MKKLLLLPLMLFFICSSASSQDLIELFNREILNCKIQKEDSANIYLKLTKNDREIETFISKSDVKSIKYGDAEQENNQDQTPASFDIVSIGLGLGFDFGGIGGNLLVYPQHNFGLFLGVGYAYTGLGFNVGTKIRLTSETSTSNFGAFGLAMYGYNAAISVENMPSLSKLFYGPTVGFGFDYKSSRLSSNYWSFALLIPIRGSKVDDYLKQNNINLKTSLLPIGFSCGYHFGLN